MPKLTFQSAAGDPFYPELKELVKRLSTRYAIQSAAKRLLWTKLLFYSLLFTGAYCWLLCAGRKSLLHLAACYTTLGLSGILLAFNAAHDAVHRTFSKSRLTNQIIYALAFNLQGVSGYLWQIRHLRSHHVFPNVDGCDADIDDNPFLRLSPHQPLRAHHRYQHWYAVVLYALYTLHWILLKDVHYLRKRNLANLRNQRFPAPVVARILLWKAGYFGYMLAIPALALDVPFVRFLAAFAIMHGVISLFFVLTLIISHLCRETAFPVADKDGMLPLSFHRHQLAVSMDYHPRSQVANFLFGGFNAHVAHHLFPELPHTCYPVVSKAIHRMAAKHRCAYHELSMARAIRSHFLYLRDVGSAGTRCEPSERKVV